MADREGNHPVGCGYGLLGLCCDSCLGGPCRRSPFDDDAGEAVCGEDRDWIVANNLMERVLRESLQAMAAFRDAPGAGIAVPDNRIAAPRLEEMKSPPLPFFPGRERDCWKRSTPNGPFPRSTPWDSPGDPGWRNSWTRPPGARPRRREPEAILADALRLSAIALAAEALSRETGRPGAEEDFTLPDTPSPLLIIVADEKDVPMPSGNRC